MKHYIRALSNGLIHKKEISIEEFENIKSIVDRHNVAFRVEELYSFFLKSYLAYEEIIVKKILENIVYEHLNWVDVVEDIQDINISIMNHMTMFKSYLDCVPQQLKLTDPSSDIISKFKIKTKEIYDKYIGYRVIYSLRNHVQHSGVPVYSLTTGMKWEDGVCVHRLEPFILVGELEKNKSFKLAVLEELRAIGSKLDVRKFLKNNMSAMADLHNFVRSFYSESSNEYRGVIQSVISEFEDNLVDDGIYYIELVDSDSDCKIPLVFDKPDVLDYLIRRNKTLTNFESHRFASSI